MHSTTRRRILQSTGVVAGTLLAGCGGNDEDDGPDGDISGDEYPDIDDWLSGSEVGGADDSYDGTLVDRTGQDTVTIEVGASGNGGNLAFGPSAVVVSTGTDIEWEWTGGGGAHNVVADPENQIGASDYAFDSGNAVNTTGVEFTQTLDEAGIALYHCTPHLVSGMKGGIAVQPPTTPDGGTETE